LLEKLGEGGFGQVWKARDDNGFEVALKFLRLDVRTGAAEQRALEVMKNVRHPHVLPMFRSWQVGHWLVLALELGGKTLYHRLAEVEAAGQVGIPLPELLEYLAETAKGLDYLHELNIQHRDVKPHNLLLVGGAVKVADFGLAKLLEHSLASNSGSMTPAYAAPEQIQGVMSPHADQYSLAVSYCQLRGGRLPFVGETPQVLYGHLQGKPDLTMLPETERPAVARALAKGPDERWPSCRHFVDALTRAAPSLPPRAVPSTLRTHHALPRRPGRRRAWTVAGGALVVLAAAAALLARDRVREGDAGTGVVRSVADSHRGKDRADPAGGVTPPGPPALPAALHIEVPDPVVLRAGTTTTRTIRIRRENWPDRAEVVPGGLPAGVRVSPAILAAGEERVRLTLTAEPTAPAARCEVVVTARSGAVEGRQRFRLTVLAAEAPAAAPPTRNLPAGDSPTLRGP
jgi:hypothetical protein